MSASLLTAAAAVSHRCGSKPLLCSPLLRHRRVRAHVCATAAPPREAPAVESSRWRLSFSSSASSSSSSSSSSSTLPPDVAGRRAYELRRRGFDDRGGDGGATESMSTLLSHAGLMPQEDGNGPLSPPIELATTYERPPDGRYELEGGGGGRIYARTDNPTREALERAVAAAEVLRPRRGGAGRSASDADDAVADVGEGSEEEAGESPAACAAFSSGMAAVSAVLLAHSSPVRVVLPDDVYHGVPTALRSVLDRHGVTWSAVDMTAADAVRDALIRARNEVGGGDVVLWIETPSNPLCKVTDIRALCELAAELREGGSGGGDGAGIGGGITAVVDSTWAPPPITQPLLLGADAVLHSATKYLGGHSDVLMGVVASSPFTSAGRRLGASLRQVQTALGAVASPFDSWLTLRGLRTLDVRLRRQCSTAAELARFLSDHPLVERVHYPGLPSHPGRSVASRQMSDGMYGGMLSFEVRDAPTAMAAAAAVRTARRATSLGGTETLIEHRASIEPEGRSTSPPGLLRLSVGLEDPGDLREDLDAALRVAERVVRGGGGGGGGDSGVWSA